MTSLFLTIWLSSQAQEVSSGDESSENWQTTVITDPSVSTRCQILIQKRKEKINNRQKLEELLQRNKKLQSLTPKEKVTLLKRLSENQYRISKELVLYNDNVEHLTEDIVRKGCPGISL